jgi:hypothetical protein
MSLQCCFRRDWVVENCIRRAIKSGYKRPAGSVLSERHFWKVRAKRRHVCAVSINLMTCSFRYKP